jgi:glycosyltransferase involved in cell wall biosynthesis
MRVAYVLGTSGGGTGSHVRMLADGCAARGIAVRVFGPAQTSRDFAFPGFTQVEVSDRPRAVGDPQAVLKLRRLLRGADVVHAHGLRAGALAAIALGTVRRRPPLVVTVHNAPAAGGAIGAIYRMLELIVARRADSVLCVSADLADRMRAAGARRTALAIVPAPAPAPPVPSAGVPAGTPHAIAQDVPAGTPHAESGHPVVLAVGRLAAQKAFDVLIEAAARWRDVQPRPRLMIVGQGPLEAELKSQAASLGVQVEFTGQREDVPELLASAAVFVLPSRWEGQPLILQEALRAGAPIVATRTGGSPALTGEDAALLVPPGDAAQLAGAVRAVLTDAELAGRLRKAALNRARTLPGEDDAVTAAISEYQLVAR